MPHITTITGSPFAHSRSSSRAASALHYLETVLAEELQTDICRLDATELLQMHISGLMVQPSLEVIAVSSGIIISSHIYEAAYTGVLKTLLDVLPPQTLAGKVIFPITTGSALSQMLTGGYMLTPVLASLGATCILPSVHILDSQIEYDYQSDLSTLSNDAKKQLDNALLRFVDTFQPEGYS